jgi:hypothetical protein
VGAEQVVVLAGRTLGLALLQVRGPEPALFEQGFAQLIMKLLLARAQVHGPAATADRLVVVAKCLTNLAEAGPEIGVVGLLLEGLAVELLRLCEGSKAVEPRGDRDQV